MPSKIDALFGDLQSRGFAKDKSLQQFRDYMLAPGEQGYKNRKAFYDDFKSRGMTNIGSYEEFSRFLNLAPKGQAPVQKQTEAWWESDPAFQQDQQQHTEKVYNPAEDTMGAFVGAAIAQPPKQQPQQSTQKPAAKPSQGGYKPTWQEQWAMGITLNQAGNDVANATRPIDQRQQNAKIYQKKALGQRPELGRKGRVVEDNGGYIDEEGTRHNVMVDANARQRELETDYTDSLKAQLDAYYGERERIQKEIDNTPQDWVDADGRTHSVSAADKQKRAELIAQYQDIDKQIKELNNNPRIAAERENDPGFLGVTKDKLGAGFIKAGLGLLNGMEALAGGMIVDDASSPTGSSRAPEYDPKNPNNAVSRGLKQANEYAENMSRKGEVRGGRSFTDLLLDGDIGGFLLKGWGTGLESAPMTLSAYNPYTMALNAISMAGNNFRDNTIDNPDIPGWKRAAMAIGSAAIEQAVEKYSDPIFKYVGGSSKKVTQEVVDEATKTIAGRIKNVLKDAAGEGFEEVMTNFGNDVLGQSLDWLDGESDYGIVAQWRDLKKQNPNADLGDFALQKAKENIDAFFGGALAGAYTSGGAQATVAGLQYAFGGKVGAEEITSNPNQPVHPATVDIAQSFDRGFAYETDDDKNAVADRYTANRQQALTLVDEETLNKIDRDPMQALGNLDQYGLDTEGQQVLGEYIGSKAEYDGMQQRIIEDHRASRPNYVVNGNNIDEVDAEGNVVATHEYADAEEMKTGLWELQAMRDYSDMQADINMARLNPRHDYDSLVAAFAGEEGMTPEEVEQLINTSPLDRSEEADEVVSRFAELLHNTLYDSTTVHEEQSAQDGATLADAMGIDLNNLSPQQAQQAAQLTETLNTAKQALDAAFAANEDLAQEVQRMEQQGMPHQGIVSSLDTFRPAEVQTVIDFYNAQAKYEGFLNQMGRKIDEEAANSRKRHTLNGTINGQADVRNVYTITDGTNEYYLVSGDVTTDPATGRITGSNSGLIIGMDLDGSLVQLGDGSGYSVMQPTMSLDQFEEAERTRLQEQVTSVIDPMGVMDNSQQGNEEFQGMEQQVPTDGTNSSTQGNEPEPSPVVPTRPVNSPSPAGGAEQAPVTIESVTDKDGIKRYEQGIPVDDAITDIQNDGFDVNEVADASIAEAQQTVDKINQKSTKTRKDLMDRKNAQDIIDYYNNVKARWAEMNAPAESEENVNIQPEQPAVEEKTVSSQSKLTVEEQKQQRIAEAKAKYGELFDDDFTKANDVFELVSMWVGRKRNLAWDDVNGKRGLQKELGWARKIGGDTKFIETLLAANGEGMGVDEFVHMVWESPENSVNGEKRWDDTEIKNALLELLKSARSKSDVVDYALNTRIKAAEAALEAQQQRQQEIEETGEAQVENLTAEQIADMEANLPFAQPTDEDIPDSPITLLGKAIAELQKQEGMPEIKLVDTDRMNGSDWIDLTSQVYGGAFMDEETVNEVRDYALTTGVIRDDDGTILVFSDSQTPEDVKSKIQTILDYANTLQEEGRNDGRDSIVERTETKTPQEQEPATPATEGATDSESQGGTESDPDGIASRITENGEPTEEPSDNGTVYKQEYLIDGKHSVTKVDEPNNKGDYTGSYYLYNGKRYGDLNEIVRDIDISERHQKEYDEYIKPLLSRTDEELQQMAKKKEDAVNGELKQLEGDLEYSAIKNVLAQREIDREREDIKDFIDNTIDDEDITFVDKVTQKELDELNHLIDEYGVDDSEGKIEDYVKRLRKKYPADKKNSTDNPVEAIERAAQSFREEQKEREEKKQENKPRYGADNKLVTTDRYEELKKRMKEKLLGQANVGFDPEILSIGTEMAVYHVEAGARKFTDFAQRMIEELGDAIRPYLKAIYNGAREMPGMEELRKEMTSYEEVSALDVQNIAKEEDNSVNVNKQENNEPKKDVNLQQEPASELEGDSAEFAERQYKIEQLSKKIRAKLQGIANWGDQAKPLSAYKQIAKEVGMENLSDTDLQELIETEIVNLAREIANKEGLTDEKKFQKIVKLYEGQPSLNTRDNDRINKQQYSTPAPMAYLMGKFLKEGKDVKSGLEPSAGNGMLTLNLPKEAMHVNDIDEMRLSNLQKQGFGEVTNQDGTQPFGEKQYDVIVTNPPFGSVTPKTYDGLYEISALEHQMAINALESMKDDGRAAIIIGGNTEYNTNGTIKGKDRAFLNYLYAHYNVADVINMDGKTLYSRQGTCYPTRMILINGRKEFDQKDFAPVQSKARAEQVKSYDELFKRVNDDILSDKNKPTSVHNTESGEGRRVDDSGHAGASTQTGVRNVQSGGSGEQPQSSTQSRSNVQRSDNTTGKRTKEPRGTVLGGGLFDFGSGSETSQPSGSTTAQTDNRREGDSERRDNAERPSATTDNSQRLGQRGTGTPQSNEQPAVKRGLGTEKVPYRKQSGNPFTLQSLMPAEQADVVKKALEDLGDVDQYLVDELGYSGKEELHQALAAEQIDSVAMAIHQMNQGNAFIIGDQTGIGKGRQAAALIRYGVKKGSFPVFITVKKALFSDMYRDLCDIGSPKLRPFIWSAGDTEKSANVTDKDGNVVYERPNDKEQKRVVDYINKYGKLPPEYDYVLTTYDSFKSGTMDYENGQKKARSFGKKQPSAVHYNGQAKRDALEKLAGNSFVIMDESHNAGGEGSNVSNYLQYITTKAKGLTFLSATFAKRPGNMPIYSLKTAIAKAGVKVDELIDAVKRGGATFQEIMSKALTEAGQMIRRERNMEGVTIDWRGIEDEDVIQKQREQYDTIIGLFNDIIDFQRTYVDPIVNKMNDDAAEVQGEVDHTPGTRDMGINNTPFASRTYNMVQQVLLSLKAEEAAKRAIEHLKLGRKPVITVANTNEGAADEASTGEDMEMPDLSINLKKGLQGTLRITKKDAFGNTAATAIPFEQLSEDGRKRYAEIMDAIENASSGLSLSPIDVIKNELKKAGYKVGELTGRKAEFVYNEDGTVKRVKRQDTDKKKVAADFNNGNLDALILNRSAGTGISLHASSKFKDQRQRIMIVAQAQGDVNDEVQIRGRIDRTGQVLRGMYEYVVSQIPSEQRLLMMLKAKLRSLDANTTSSQKSKFNEMQVQDIINKYGDDIVIQYLAEHPDLAMKMCDPLKWGEGAETLSPETLISQAEKAQGDGATASKVLGRMALLTVKEQEKMLQEVGDLYQAEIDRLNEMGENDLEITEMPLRAKTLKKDVWEEGVEPGGKNPFADNSYVEEVEMDVLRKPMKAEEVKKSQARLLGGKTWDEYKQDVLNKANDWADKKKEEATKTFTERAEKKATAEKEKYAKGAKKAQEKNGMTDAEIEKNAQFQYDTFYKHEMEKLQNALEAIDKQKDAFDNALDTFTTDGVYALPTDIYDLGQLTFEPSFGKVIDIKISDNFSTTASTISFATLDGRRKITIPISGMVKQNNGEKRDIKPVIVQQTAQTRNGMFGSNVANTLKVLEQNVDNWDKLTSTATRKKGHIITGNLLKALTSLRSQGKGGKLISYTTDTGEIRQGILMGDNFDPGVLTSKNPISSAKADLDDWGTNRKITSADGDVTIKADGYGSWMSYTLKVPKSKKKGEKYFNDKTLLSLMDGQFEGSSALKADFKAENLDAVLKRLDELGVTVESAKEDTNNTNRRFDEDIESEENINNNSEGESSKDLFLSLQQKQGDEYNETVNEIGERVYSGRASLYGQGEKSWRGKTSRVAAVAEVISAEHAKNTGASSVHEAPFGDQVVGTERKIEEWSKADGCWLNEEEIAKNSLGGKPISVRSQSKVYLSKDGNTAIKLTYPYGMLAFLRNISIFNKLFPETAYTITGFTRDEKGKFRIVMKQPYIVGKQYSKEEYEQNGIKDKVEKYFYNLGLYPYYNNFSNQVFDVSDIYNENVIIDEFGNVNIIDADVSLEPRFLITEYRDKAIEYEDVTERRYDEDTNIKTAKTQEIKRKNRIAKHIDNLVKKLGTKARTTVYHSFDELPADMKKYIREREKQGRKVRGWYENGHIYLYLPHIDSIYQAEKTIWHETVAHHGLRELVGAENYNQLLKRLWLEHRDGEMGKWVTERMQTNGWSLAEAIDEYLAREAEKNPFKEPGLWQRLRWMVADILHKMGFTSDPTISDIQYLFWVSENQLREGDPMTKIRQQAFLFNLERQASTTPYINMNASRPEDIDNPDAEGAYDDGTRHSEETDEEVIERLEKEPKIKVYRAMQLIDGKLYPPMAAKQGGKLVNPIELGKWEKADEHPEMADENGKFKLDKGNGKSLKAAYNPYIHTSTTMLNDQFSEAQSRPNLVVVEVEVPESELTSGYKAEKAKDAVGRLEWKAGIIQGQLTGTREVILSRWDKPVRIVPTEEVAKSIANQINGKVDVMPTNVVTPAQREALEKEGVKFVETDNRGFITEGEHKGSTYSSVYGKRRKNSPANSSDYTIGEYKTTGILPGQLTLTEARVTDSKGNVVARLYKTENGYQAETPSMSYMTGVYSTEKKAIDALRRETSGSRRFDEDIDDPLEYSAKQVYNERLNRVETVFSEAYQDAMVSLKTAQNAIAGDNDIPDSQNAYMAENLMHGKNKNEMDLFNSMFRDPLIKTINKIMNLTGMNWGDVDRYVYTKSGLERNREFFVRDWLEAERNKNIRKYEDLSPEERDIFDRKAATIETLFEDGDIETEEQKEKELAKALKEAHKEYVDEVERQYQRVKSERFMDLQIGNSPALGMDSFSFADYLGEIDKFIRDNIDPDYVASEHDYSGFRAMYGDEKGKYNEDAIIEELMDTEDQIEAENVNTLWEQIQNATRYGLERYREAGMRSDEQIDQIEQMFHWYVPMRGFKENMGEDMYQYFTQKGTAKSYIGGLLKHAKGRGSEAQYPISTIFAMTYKAISDCNQNLVNQKLYRLCQANPNDLIILSDSWAVINEVTGEWEEVAPDIPEDADEEDVRQITLAWEDDMRQLASENKAKKIKGRERFDYKPMDKKKQSEHIVDVRINGNPRKMIVTSNPRMAQALNGQLRFERGKNVFSKWNAAIKNMMATFFTSYSPTFALRNMFRDWTHFRTMLGVREGHGYAKQANKYYRQSLFKMVGLFKKYRNGSLDEGNEMERDFKNFMDNGGVTGFVQMTKIGDIQKEMEKLYSQQKQGKTIRLNNKLWEYTLGAVEALNEGIENNARFATYRASRHYAGRTRARSAYDAKEITVNFNRKGAGSKTAGFKSQSKTVEDAAKAFGVTSQILGEGRIFFNATVQAIATTFKNFQNSDGSLNKPYIAKWAGKYALPPFMFGLALPLINKALAAALGGDGDDDPYGNLPEWTRRKNLCFYIGNGNFITIPIGQELAAFLTLGDIAAGNTYAPNLKPVDRSWDDEMLGVMNTFSPVDVDTKITKGGLMEDPVDETIGRTFSVLAPLVAVQQNLGWTGRPIYREDRFPNDQYTPEYQMVYSGTNPVLVNASKLLHELGGGDDVTRGKMEVNPAIVQYLWEQYTGGPGKVFSNTISIGKDAKDILSGNESDFNIRKVEGLKAFVQQGDDRTQYYRTQAKYRKYSEDAKKLYDAVKGYENGAAENPEYVLKLEQISKGEDFVRMQIVREADKQLSQINKAANKADGAERKELRRLYNQQVKAVVDMLDEVGE